MKRAAAHTKTSISAWRERVDAQRTKTAVGALSVGQTTARATQVGAAVKVKGKK